MKRLSLPIVCCLLLALLPAQSVGAVRPLAADLNFQHTFLAYSDQLNDHPWWQSHTVVDPQTGRVHTAYFTDGYIYYATCAADCTLSANWKHKAVASAGTYSSLTFPTLSLDSAGRPRMMYYLYPYYVYAECSTDCAQSGTWKTVDIPLNPDFINIYPQNPRYFALDPQNRPRFISPYVEGLTYAYCNSGCTTASNWQYAEITFGWTDNIEAPQVEFTSSGSLRVGGYNGWTNDLLYARCDQSCSLDENWSWVKVAGDVGDTTFTMRHDSAGRPRFAYYKMFAADKRMYYAWSDTNHTTAASWTTDTLDLAPDINRTLDMAIDSQGSPHIVYVDENADLRYLRCTSACNTMSSEWWLQYVETRDDLDTYHYIDPGGFDFSAWSIDGYASLALDSSGSPLISYYVRNEVFSGISPYPNVWAVRFAAARNLGHQVFLPFLRK